VYKRDLNHLKKEKGGQERPSKRKTGKGAERNQENGEKGIAERRKDERGEWWRTSTRGITILNTDTKLK